MLHSKLQALAATFSHYSLFQPKCNTGYTQNCKHWLLHLATNSLFQPKCNIGYIQNCKHWLLHSAIIPYFSLNVTWGTLTAMSQWSSTSQLDT